MVLVDGCSIVSFGLRVDLLWVSFSRLLVVLMWWLFTCGWCYLVLVLTGIFFVELRCSICGWFADGCFAVVWW